MLAARPVEGATGPEPIRPSGLLAGVAGRLAPRLAGALGPYLRPLILFVIGGILISIGLRRQLV